MMGLTEAIPISAAEAFRKSSVSAPSSALTPLKRLCAYSKSHKAGAIGVRWNSYFSRMVDLQGIMSTTYYRSVTEVRTMSQISSRHAPTVTTRGPGHPTRPDHLWLGSDT